MMVHSDSWGNQYDTPTEKKRSFLDKLSLDTRLYFWMHYIGIVLQARYWVARGRHGGQYLQEASLKSMGKTFRLIEACGGRFHITGLDHVRQCDQAAVYISNHMSTLETNIIPYLIFPFRDATFVLKESLLNYPVFGKVLAPYDPIAVSRVNPRADFQAVMTQGQELLGRGRSVVVFPQSTRFTSFAPDAFSTIGIKLAKRANVPIVPVAVKTDFWGNNERYLKDLGPLHREQPIHIAFGEPFYVTGKGKEAHKKVLGFIGDNLTKWGVPTTTSENS